MAGSSHLTSPKTQTLMTSSNLLPSPTLLPSVPTVNRHGRGHRNRPPPSEHGSEFTTYTTNTNATNNPNNSNSRRKSKAGKIWQQNFYDKFNLVLSSISVSLHTSPGTTIQFIKKFDVNVEIQKSVIPQDYTLSKVKVSTVVDSIVIDLSPGNISTLSSLLKSTLLTAKTGAPGDLRRSSTVAVLDKFKVPSLPSPPAEATRARTLSSRSQDLDIETLVGVDKDDGPAMLTPKPVRSRAHTPNSPVPNIFNEVREKKEQKRRV